VPGQPIVSLSVPTSAKLDSRVSHPSSAKACSGVFEFGATSRARFSRYRTLDEAEHEASEVVDDPMNGDVSG
jgi:hypothetical protein